MFLRILPTWLWWLLSLLASLLPAPLRARLESRHPEFFLPEKIVLKRAKREWDSDQFGTERDIYKVLTPLQGTVVPKCYGQVECRKTNTTTTWALILSHVDGVSLHLSPELARDKDKLEAMLFEAYRSINRLRVRHQDRNPSNFIIVGDKIVVIDFDNAYIVEGPMEGHEDPDNVASADANSLSRFLECWGFEYFLGPGGK